MSRAEELMPIDRSATRDLGLPKITDDMRAGLDITEQFAPLDDGPDVRLVVYRPTAGRAIKPAVLSIHGGAFCLMHPEDFAGLDAAMALAHDAVVIAVDYRLAPEHPFPAVIDDCWASLSWTVAQAEPLRIDTERLVVTGGSAGGALSAALCLMARDRGGPSIAYQGLMIPVIDDRCDTPSMRQCVEHPGFSTPQAEGMWLHYLGDDYDRSSTSPYAAPARAESLAGLPPAFILTGGLDPLRDEGLLYGLRLLADGVPVELHNVPGAYHGAPPLDVDASERGRVAFQAALGNALNGPSRL